MHNDETLWICIKDGFCSFKVKWKEPKQDFCRNKYNNTGLCNRTACPLANSQYATIIEEEGINYLYMKTVERAHSPKNLWERVKLSRNFLQALEQINDHMKYWPQGMINRCKQRLTKIRQMLIRMRKFSLKDGPRLIPIKTKTDRREKHREIKAELAAKVDLAIERELLERLKQGTYGDIYNFPQKNFEVAIDGGKRMKEEEAEANSEGEFIEDMDEEEEEEREEDNGVEEVEVAEDFERAMEDLEDLADTAAGIRPDRKKRRAGGARSSGPRVELEYEQETG